MPRSSCAVPATRLPLQVHRHPSSIERDCLNLAKEAAEGIFGIADYVPGASEATRKYAADYLKEYNEEFDPTSAWTYDGLNILVNAIKKGGEDRAKIREALLATRATRASWVPSLSPER